MNENLPKNYTPPFDPNNIVIKNHPDYLDIRINKSVLKEHRGFDIIKYLTLVTSPFFFNATVPPNLKQAESAKRTVFPRVAFFCEDKGHYTGGRYSVFEYALLLSMATEVTFVTNLKPPFINDFMPYSRYFPNFRVEVSENFKINATSNSFDIVVGVPITGGEFAVEYADRWKIPFHSMLFESPNWMQSFKEPPDYSDDDFWKGYKGVLKRASRVYLPSVESEIWFKKWDPEFEDKDTVVIYPPMNELIAMEVKYVNPQKEKTKKVKRVVYCSRMAAFKNAPAIIEKLPKDIEIHVIGAIWKDSEDRLSKLENVIIHKMIPDKKKFEIIQSADVLIHPSSFEGAGMPPMEALWFNKQVVAYDLPVLKEIYGNSVNFVKQGNTAEFVKATVKVLGGETNGACEFPEHLRMKSVASKLNRNFGIPSITVGTIAYNCADYLEQAIKSVYSVASQIIIVEGAVKGYAASSHSTDETLKAIERLIEYDIFDKIKIIQKDEGFWADKIEMQNAIAKEVNSEYYVKVDADEIWRKDVLPKAVNFLAENGEFKFIRMPFVHFWTNFRTVCKDAGGKWNTKHARVWRWSTGMFHHNSFNIFTDNHNDMIPVWEPNYKGFDFADPDYIFHFGYARDLKSIANKIKYYGDRGIEDSSTVENLYEKWEGGSDKTMCTQTQVRSWAEPWDKDFKTEFPEVMTGHKYMEVVDIRKHN